jgi:dethiobiotin synthetase
MIPGLRGLFVTGTDTGVGKTRVASSVVRKLAAEGRSVGVMKPVASGAVRRENGTLWSEDAGALIEATGTCPDPERVAPILYEEPLSPPVAARRAGGALDHDRVVQSVRQALAWWAGRAEVVVVEGVGGLLCPLAEGTTVADLAVALDFPLVVVARRGLGTLNHTLLTVEAARHRGLRIAGIVLNGAEPTENAAAEETNAAELARRVPGVPILAERPFDPGGTLPDPVLRVDWYERALPGRLSPPAESWQFGLSASAGNPGK